MSGKPWPEGVSKAVSLLERLEALEREIHDLTPKRDRLKVAETEYHQASYELTQHLNSMDVSSEQKGNSGWGGRLGWFLQEMRRQAKHGLPGMPTP